MKSFSLRILEYLHQDQAEVIATFGQAQLVRHLNGRCEIRGGTPSDYACAREWCSLFLHEVSVPFPKVTR